MFTQEMFDMNFLLNNLPAIFNDIDLDNEIKTKFKDAYLNINLKRSERYSTAFKEWMKDFPKSPLPTKTALENMIAGIEGQESKHFKALENLNKCKNDLQQGLYCEGTNEHALYKGAYEDRKLAFVWPTGEELILRQQEESELLSKINNK